MKRLEDAAAIINLIEPLPKDLQLHLTTIRNENAYYCCIRKLLSTPGISNTPSTEKVYIIGDSHVLSLAWRSIVVANKSYLLSPRLVTGLKHCMTSFGCRMHDRSIYSSCRASSEGHNVLSKTEFLQSN